MAILLDASAILAAADTADLNHAAARAWFASADEPLLVGALTLAEADHVLQRELGPASSLALLDACRSGAVRVVAPTDGDLDRAAGLLRAAVEHRPRLADALLVAAAERLGVRRVATFDRRPLAVLLPRGPRGERVVDLEP
jgi:predicted nucleic acid-binding protein